MRKNWVTYLLLNWVFLNCTFQMFKKVFGDQVAVHQNQNVEVSISFENEHSC